MRSYKELAALVRYLLVAVVLVASYPSVAMGQSRLALLVGNQQGWSPEPSLDYVLSGDLRPMSKRLKALGFRVVALENRGAMAVRRAFQRLLKAQGRRTIQTFVFYYSGHADQNFFHLGRRGKKPLSYAEFAGFFRRLTAVRKIAIFDSCYSGEVIRRFGSLSRYKKLLRGGKAKGIRGLRKLALHRLLVPKRGHEEGLRIIASSLDISWELKQHKASVFTYHLLEGLKGPADRNHDGSITVDELFDYTSQQVLQETGQRPQQLVVIKRSNPFTFAPVYRSRLRIGSNVVGKIKVSVANFVWTRNKEKNRPLRLAVVDGKGTVSLEHQGTCFRQAVRFPKGGEALLTPQWKKVPCRRLARRRKGTLYLQAQPFVPQVRKPTEISIALSAGYTRTYTDWLNASNWGGGVQLRWGKHFGVGVHTRTGTPEDKEFWLSAVWLRPEFGYTWSFFPSRFRVDLRLGAYLHLGLTFQHKEAIPTRSILLAGAGGAFDISWWFQRHIGVRLGGLTGFNYTPVLDRSPIALEWNLQTSLLLGF